MVLLILLFLLCITPLSVTIIFMCEMYTARNFLERELDPRELAALREGDESPKDFIMRKCISAALATEGITWELRASLDAAYPSSEASIWRRLHGPWREVK